MLIGYARSKSDEREIDTQIKELKKHGCQEIYTDIGFAGKRNLVGLKSLLENVAPGDVIVVLKVSILGKPILELISLINTFTKMGIDLISLNKHEHIDTSSSHGKELLNLLNIFAKCEKEIISEFTQKGLDAARKMGRTGGRPSGLSNEAKQMAEKAAKAYREGKLSVTEICKMLNIARSTFYNYLKHEGVELVSNKRKSRRIIKK